MRSFTLAFGGDVNLGRRQHYFSRRDGYAAALGELEILRTADLSLCNLECVVACSGRHKVNKAPETGPYYFRARPEQLQILTLAGISLVATANNHSGDYGPEALLEQSSWLALAGLQHAGSGPDLSVASAPLYTRVGGAEGLTVALFSVDAVMRPFAAGENTPGVWHLPLAETHRWFEEYAPRIALARERADLVLVAAHWGLNWLTEPVPEKIAAGHALIDAGADAVLGSSAHTLHGVEIYRGRPIIHDAGDLLSDARPRNCMDSGLFTLDISS